MADGITVLRWLQSAATELFPPEEEMRAISHDATYCPGKEIYFGAGTCFRCSVIGLVGPNIIDDPMDLRQHDGYFQHHSQGPPWSQW